MNAVNENYELMNTDHDTQYGMLFSTARRLLFKTISEGGQCLRSVHVIKRRSLTISSTTAQVIAALANIATA